MSAKKMICHHCKEIREIKEDVRNYNLTPKLTIKNLTLLVCVQCNKSIGIHSDQSPKIKEATESFKAIRPSLERIMDTIPENQRKIWVNHYNEESSISLPCDCDSTSKGADCDGKLSNFLYDKSDWKKYINS